jgi:uncharacterized protein YycO/photosystem II stability/assembly factor-like uncharacterized protein
VQDVVIDPHNPSRIYAGGSSGLAKSMDGGQTWTVVDAHHGLGPSEAPTVPVFVRDIAIGPDGKVYAVVSWFGNYGGLFKSIDAGSTWTAVARGTMSGTTITSDDGTVFNAVAVNSQGHIYVSRGLDFRRGIFKSTDGGATWSVRLSDIQVGDIKIDPANDAVIYVGVSQRYGAMKSSDGGNTWRDTIRYGNAIFGSGVIAIDPTNPATVYAAIDAPSNGGGIYKSVDAGATSQTLNNGWVGRALDLLVDKTNPTVLYATSENNGIYIFRPAAIPPVAKFKWSPEKPMVGGLITLDASESSDPDGGKITEYKWDFGAYGKRMDNPPNNANPVVQFISPRKHTVTLTVIDSDGQQGSTSQELDLALEEGDLILVRNEWSLVLTDEWTHVGMYAKENGEDIVIEADNFGVFPDDIPQSHVDFSNLSRYFWDNRTYVRAVRVSAPGIPEEKMKEIREKAVLFAKKQKDKGYDFLSLASMKQPSGEKWYCSELVWAAYLDGSAQVGYNIDLDEPNQLTKYLGLVHPDEIDLSDKTSVIGEHKEKRPETVWTLAEPYLKNGLILFAAFSPVDLEVTDPDGLIINKYESRVPQSAYQEYDISGDGEVEDVVVFFNPKTGEYQLRVVPEPDALPDETYSIEVVNHGGATIVLAKDVQVKDASLQPYRIMVTQEKIDAVPLITLIGDNPISLELGTPYQEPGATAQDAEEGNLTDSIVITGAVDVNTEGHYTITYKVSDKAGNTATETRTVNVVATPNSYALLAGHSMELKQNASVHSGFMGVLNYGAPPFLEGGVELAVGINAETAEAVRVSGPRVQLKQNADIKGTLVYTELESGKKAVIAKPVQVGRDYWPLLVLPAFRTGTPGNQDVEVKQNKDATLTPGAYRDVQIQQKGKLTFTGGVYELRSLDAGQNANIYFQGPTTLLVNDKFSLDQKSYFGPAPGSPINASDILVYVNGTNGKSGNLNAGPEAAKVGINATFVANLYALNGTIELRQNSKSTGSFIGRDVSVGINADVYWQSGWKTPGVTFNPSAPLAKKPTIATNPEAESVTEKDLIFSVENHPNPLIPLQFLGLA